MNIYLYLKRDVNGVWDKEIFTNKKDALAHARICHIAFADDNQMPREHLRETHLHTSWDYDDLKETSFVVERVATVEKDKNGCWKVNEITSLDGCLADTMDMAMDWVKSRYTQ